MCILGEIRIQPSSGLCSSSPHSASCVTLIWATLPHSGLNGFCPACSLRAAHLQLLVVFADICLNSGLKAAIQKKTFRQPHPIYALCEPILKATKEIWEKLEWQPATTVTKNTKNHKINFFPFILYPFLMFLIVDFKGNTEPAEELKPFSLFQSHTRPCLRAQVQQRSACCRSQIWIQIYDSVTHISAIPSLLGKHSHYSRQPLICIFKKGYSRSKRIFQNAVWFQGLFFAFL